MKEFENWIKQKTFYRKDTELHIAASFAWRAVLKTILKTILKQVDHFNSDGSIIAWIKEELES